MDEQAQSALTQDGFPTLQDTQNEQLTLFSLQEMAVNTTDTIDSLRDKLKTAREMLEEVYQRDSDYASGQLTVTEAQSKVKVAKQNVLRHPDVMQLENRVNEIRSELKEKKESLSTYAVEVYRLTGNPEFEKDGQTFTIKTVAKLVRKKQ